MKVSLELRFTKSSDRFMALNETESNLIPENEVAYIKLLIDILIGNNQNMD